jgi:hypothetical protein
MVTGRRLHRHPEHLGTAREEEVECILTPGHVPDEPGDGVQAIRTAPHLRTAQPVQEVSLHLRMQPPWCSTKKSMVSRVSPHREAAWPAGRASHTCGMT